MLASTRGRRAVIAATVVLATVLAPLHASASAGDIHGFAGRTTGLAYNDWIIAATGGYAGDGGPARDALLNGPRDVAFDNAGNAFIADTQNNAIRVVDAQGTIDTLIAVGVPVGLAFGSDEHLYVASGRTATAGTNMVLRVRNGGLELVAGNGTPVASGDGGPATAAGLDPRAIAFDASGNLYIADYANHRVRRVGSNGMITTVAGSGGLPDGSCTSTGDGGPATAARVCAPAGLAFDSAGRLLVMSEGPGAMIRRIDASGTITTIAGSGTCVESWTVGLHARSSDVCSMRGMALDARGNLFFSTIRGRSASHIMRIDSLSGRVTRAAGLGCEVEVASGFAGCFAGDGGPALAAGFNGATGLRFAPGGGMFIADTGNHAVRVVDPAGFLSFAPAELAFGDQEIGIASLARAVTVTNTGTVPATITSSAFEGAHAADFPLDLDACAGRTLAPGASCGLTLRFRPSAVGLRTAAVRLSTTAIHAPETPPSVGLSGNGISVPRLRVTPNPVFFGNHRVGTTTLRTVTVSSIGTQPLVLGALAIPSGSIPDYSIAADGCSGLTMAPGLSCTVDVSFVPVENGYRNSLLRVPSNAGPNPLDVALLGSAGPLLTITPALIDFGGVRVGSTSGEHVVTVTNIGSDAAVVTSSAIGGVHAGDFVFTHNVCAGGVVLPSASCTIGLAFRPTVTGVRNGRLDVLANAPQTNGVLLTGTGLDPGAPVSRFVTADHAIVLGFAEPVLGESDDIGSGVSRVTVFFDPVIGAPLTINANLTCNPGRTHCTWSVRVPLTLIGPVLVHAVARDAQGNVETPGPTISVLML